MKASVYVFCLVLFSHFVPLISAGNETRSQEKCPSSFNCGNLGKIQFPFTITERRDCGLLAIQGCDSHVPNPSQLRIIKWSDELPFAVLYVDPSKILVRDFFLYGLLESKNCEAFSKNFTLPPSSRLASFHAPLNATLFRCNRTLNVSLPKNFFKYTNCPDYDILYGPPSNDEAKSLLSACSITQLPSKGFPDTRDPFTFISSEITIEAQLSDDCDKCYNLQKGRCQLDSNRNFHCAKVAEKTLGVSKLGLGSGSNVACVCTVGGAGVALLLIVACCYRRKLSLARFFYFFKMESSTHQNIEDFLKYQVCHSTRRYNYSEIKKMTNSLRDKLGKGGYGSVYKGKLPDGRLVAVKLLSESKGNGEEFINEVASISRTSHVNIVRLLGFCLQGSRRALIYEFMTNGSLEKFIYEGNILSVDYQLDCKTLYNIALGVARGLEYLHRGCNTRILHFDIKPHNILLNENFCPKISDFGLAKICPPKESIVSLLGARGTIGYIAPEIISRNFGGVSHKSDVYSYGMMVLEMIGGRKNVNVQVQCVSEVYFPHWIYKRLQLKEDFDLRCIKNEDDKEIVKKMAVVSLWCIQTEPPTRPAMSEVVQMLEGALNSLHMPPKPYLTSPSTSAHCST